MTTAPPPAQTERYNVLSIVAIITVWFAGIFGLIFGYIALSQIKRTGEKGRGLALASVIIGWIALAITVIWSIVVVVALGAAA